MNDSITDGDQIFNSGNIRWIKHVTNQDGEIGAYLDKNKGDKFLLNFPSLNTFRSVRNVRTNDLIVLYQVIDDERFFTHIVSVEKEVETPEIDTTQEQFMNSVSVIVVACKKVKITDLLSWRDLNFGGGIGQGQISSFDIQKLMYDSQTKKSEIFNAFELASTNLKTLENHDTQQLLENFKEYLHEQNTLQNGSINNYVSWLKYLVNEEYLPIDCIPNINSLTVEEIITTLSENKEDREKYKNDTDISNFRSLLIQLLSYLNDNEGHNREVATKSTTEARYYLTRLGQGKYRKDLIKKYNGKCSFTDIDNINLLVASHIKPWRVSNDLERLDVENGFLLSPNYDKLFDRGYISINPQTLKIVVSNSIDAETLKILGIDVNLEIKPISERQKNYLQYHYDVFQNQNN